MPEEFKKGYKKGYEDGLKDGLSEAVSLVIRGYKPQELRLMLKSRMAAIGENVENRLGRLEDLEVRSEPEVETQEEFKLGSSYVVKESRFEKSLHLFLELVGEGKALCVTRVNPLNIKALHDLPNIKLYWLTAAEKRKEKGYGFISPTDLVTLASTILGFLSKHKKSVVLLQGAEYLISQNSFNVILKMIQKVNDSVVLTNSILLLSLNPSGIEERDYSNLLKEMTQEI